MPNICVFIRHWWLSVSPVLEIILSSIKTQYETTFFWSFHERKPNVRCLLVLVVCRDFVTCLIINQKMRILIQRTVIQPIIETYICICKIHLKLCLRVFVCFPYFKTSENFKTSLFLLLTCLKICIIYPESINALVKIKFPEFMSPWY